jgi:plastocyanin
MRNAALIATCALVTAAATAETHVVSAYDMTFVPEIVEVNVGSPHTVSTGDSCRFDGLFFAALSFIEPVFEWVVPEGGAVTIPYFCAPHCINGMVGTIHVVQPCEGELTGDGDVGGDDLLVVLSNWGGDDPSGDVDGNGIVDGEDLLILLGNWGPCG